MVQISNAKIVTASQQDKCILQRMLELHQHDLSPFSQADLNNHGEFGYTYLDHYWVETNRHPYLIRIADTLVGFALVNSHCYLPQSQYSMAEFFILKRCRRQGLGQTLAHQVFDQHSGIWEVRQLPGHTQAVLFWQQVLKRYPATNSKELFHGYGNWPGTMLQFDNSQPSI